MSPEQPAVPLSRPLGEQHIPDVSYTKSKHGKPTVAKEGKFQPDPELTEEEEYQDEVAKAKKEYELSLSLGSPNNIARAHASLRYVASSGYRQAGRAVYLAKEDWVQDSTLARPRARDEGNAASTITRPTCKTPKITNNLPTASTSSNRKPSPKMNGAGAGLDIADVQSSPGSSWSLISSSTKGISSGWTLVQPNGGDVSSS